MLRSMINSVLCTTGIRRKKKGEDKVKRRELSKSWRKKGVDKKEKSRSSRSTIVTTEV